MKYIFMTEREDSNLSVLSKCSATKVSEFIEVKDVTFFRGVRKTLRT